jgi:hypothetical protein
MIGIGIGRALSLLLDSGVIGFALVRGDALLAVLGVAGFLIALDPHRHACVCGTAWWHWGFLSGGSARESRALAAHTCPSCSKERWPRWRRSRV